MDHFDTPHTPPGDNPYTSSAAAGRPAKATPYWTRKRLIRAGVAFAWAAMLMVLLAVFTAFEWESRRFGLGQAADGEFAWIPFATGCNGLAFNVLGFLVAAACLWFGNWKQRLICLPPAIYLTYSLYRIVKAVLVTPWWI